jgi:hypothetical protein
MILIGVINVIIGYCTYDPPTGTPEKIEVKIPASSIRLLHDAGAD